MEDLLPYILVVVATVVAVKFPVLGALLKKVADFIKKSSPAPAPTPDNPSPSPVPSLPFIKPEWLPYIEMLLKLLEQRQVQAQAKLQAQEFRAAVEDVLKSSQV